MQPLVLSGEGNFIFMTSGYTTAQIRLTEVEQLHDALIRLMKGKQYVTYEITGFYGCEKDYL
jgi:hypothetical protein